MLCKHKTSPSLHTAQLCVSSLQYTGGQLWKMEKTAGASLWESSHVMHWVVNADRVASAPGEGEDGACSSISAHSSSLPLFPSHPGCWCLESWSSEHLARGTARLPWAFLRQPVPGLQHQEHSHTFTAMDSVSVPLLLPQPCSLCDSQAWQGCPRYTQAQLGPLCLFHVGMTRLYGI